MDRIEKLRRRVGRLGDGRSRRYPRALQSKLVAVCLQQRAQGKSFSEISAQLDVSVETLRRWLRDADAKADPKDAFVAVDVIGDLTSHEVTVTTSSGHRIEGLDLGGAILLVRALS